MRTIFKYELSVCDGRQLVAVPYPGQGVHVGVQGEKICLWAEVETERRKVTRFFHVFGTGHQIPNGQCLVWIGTVQMGEFVWPVYEEVF